MRELDACHGFRVKLHQLNLLARFDIPERHSSVGLAASHHILRVGCEASLQRHNAQIVETRSEFVQLFALEGIY